MHSVLETAIKHWSYISPVVSHPKNKKEMEQLQILLDELLDIVGSNEKHPLMELVDIMSDRIAFYEAEHESAIMGSGIDALKYLMEAHHLRQCDLPEIGSQGVVSEILNGKRPLNIRQITALSKRFHVDPATFIDENRFT